jgi:1-phosphatidylinositol-4-phosphate 5-kinase
MMKTIPLREFDKFRNVLKAYYSHMRAYKDSLISRFYGLHEVCWIGSDGKEQKRYLVIMNNVFTDFAVGVKFDLKGSSHGRSALRNGERIADLTEKQLKTALKDNDFRTQIKVIKLDEKPPAGQNSLYCKKRPFHEIIMTDTEFFIHAQIIDYSLLLGEIVDVEYHELRDHIQEFPELGNGIYFEPSREKAYVIGIIDPLTGFT